MHVYPRFKTVETLLGGEQCFFTTGNGSFEQSEVSTYRQTEEMAAGNNVQNRKKSLSYALVIFPETLVRR